MEGTATVRLRMDRPTGVAHDVVSEEAVTLVGEERTGKTLEAEVHKGLVVTTPPPPLPRWADNAGRWSELLGRR